MRLDKKQFIYGILAGLCLMPLSGCNIMGFFANPGGYEQKLKPKYDLKSQSKRKILVWVDPSQSSGAGMRETDELTKAVVSQLIKKVGLPKKNIVVPTDPETLARDISIRPETLAVQAGAEIVFYIRITSFQAMNLHSNRIYSGSMVSRGVLLDVKNNQTLWPQSPQELVADVVIDTTDKGRDDLIEQLSKAAAHCLVRDLYTCRKPEYKISEERSALNEMIQQEVY